MAKKMCEICGDMQATVPDRERMGRLINRVCSSCHALRLTGDMKRILELHEKHRAKADHCAYGINRREKEVSDEMIKNKTWQHEETGRMTTCAIRPGNRWHEVGVSPDCEHEDLTGKTCAENKPTFGYKVAYEVASSMAKNYIADTNKLRAFAVEVMEAWPEGGIEGDDLQEIALKHGMLAPEIRHEPCGEWCKCNGIGGYDSDGRQRGVTCYRRTALLTGES